MCVIRDHQENCEVVFLFFFFQAEDGIRDDLVTGCALPIYEAEVIDAILAALELEGLTIELFHKELGPAQQELSISHADVLRAADNVCLVRETARGVARTFNLLASFAPKPFLDQPGSGARIHMSLCGTEHSEQRGKNLFYDSNE